MNPARPARGVRLAALDDIPDGGAVVRDFSAGEARYALLLARRGAAAFAYENACPHARMPLDTFDGRVLVVDGAIVCAMHGACFDFASGACLGGPANGPLTRVAVRVSAGAVVMD